MKRATQIAIGSLQPQLVGPFEEKTKRTSIEEPRFTEKNTFGNSLRTRPLSRRTGQRLGG